MSIFKKSFIAALAFFSFTSPVNANVITTFGAAPSGTSLETFNELPLGSHSGTFSLPSIDATLRLHDADVVQGTTSTYAAPYIGSADTSQYLAVETNGKAVFTFAQPENYFGLEWGSADTYNKLVFYDGNKIVGVVLGQAIISAAGLQAGNQGADGTVYANFDVTTDFTKVVAYSSGIAFEFDNVRAGDLSAVPLPPSLPLFMAGILGLGIIGYRSRKLSYA